jgi:hypothetical protein
MGHDWRVIDHRRRTGRWIDWLWIGGLLVVIVVEVSSGNRWLAIRAAPWVLHGLWRLRAPRPDSADDDLPPRDPSFRTPFDPPTRP